MNSDWVCLVKAPNPYEAIEKVKKISEQKKESETSSHSEKDILKGCISLMNELTDRFMDFLDYTGYEHNPAMMNSKHTSAIFTSCRNYS